MKILQKQEIKKQDFSIFLRDLASDLNVNLKHSDKAVYRYLSSEYYEHQHETFYKNINKLKPGYFFIVDHRGNKIERKFFDFNSEFDKINLPKSKSEK